MGGWSKRHFFLLRRLHSLAGLVPVGVFVTFHILMNATIVSGGAAFQTGVDQIHLLDKLGVLEVAEIFGIFLPMLFHAVLGVKIWLDGTPTVGQHRSGGNVRYTLQRVTGVVGFAFILIHLWHMHWMGKPFGGGHFDPHRAAETASAAMQSSFWYAPIYVIGVVCVVYHLANGIWTSLITWGITVGPVAQRKAGWACAVFGVIVGLAGLSAVRGFSTFDVPPAIEAMAEQVEYSGH